MTIKKPPLAEDAILEQQRFPCWEEPKIDGVRAMNVTGRLVGRSFDEFKGYMISDFFSRPGFLSFDGEMTLGEDPKAMALCSSTTGAMGRIYEEGNKKKLLTQMADIHWWVFDDLSQPHLPYADRYDILDKRVRALGHHRVHLVPFTICKNMTELKAALARNANDNYEGTITRNPNAPIKEGRATLKGQEIWRFKPWADAEILVTGITEGNINANEAKKNTLGRTERSSSAAGLIPNGQVGSIQGTLVADFYDPISGRLLFKKGLEVTVGSGEMTVQKAEHYFKNPGEIVGHLVKFKHMTHGTKDQPRFPTYISHRLKEDMS
jgi:DNA ligase-1